MPRPLALIGALSLIGVLLAPATTAQAESTTVIKTAELRTADPSPNIAPADPAAVKAGTATTVQPDVAYTSNGVRVEVYTSIGDNDNGVDWRQVNEFAYLLNSVPKGSKTYATIYNSLWDGDKAKYNTATQQWEVYDSSGKTLRTTDGFGPTQALQNQLNKYSSAAERRNYIHLLLSKKSMRDAKAAGSGLASLIYGTGDANTGIYTECAKTTKGNNGACLLSPGVDEEALMHSKYALFEKAADSTGEIHNNVVWITSANLNGASGGKKSNTSIALFGEKKGYEELLSKVWNAEVTETFTSAYLSAIPGIKGTNSDFTFYPSPRTKTGNITGLDYEANFLQASTNAALKGTKANCKAYLVHSLFSETRVGILNALATLQNTDKCSVKIVLGENAIGAIVTTYFKMSTQVRDLIDRTEFSNVHDKTLSLSYTLNGTTHGSTWGGSENFNGTSLRYDELAFRADDLTLTRAVEQQSERLYQLSRGGEATIPVKAVTVAPQGTQINVGNSVQLRARISPTNASTTQVTWKSSNTKVATVAADTGKVTAVAAGTATITATSVAGPVKGTTVVTVNNDSPEANNTDPGASAVVVSSPPTLTMETYQNPTDNPTTHVVVTWGQGPTDLSGKVTLQYYSGGKWKNYTSFTVTSGRVEKDFKFKSTRTYRLRADSVSGPSGASLTSTAKYSNGYSYVIVRTAGAPTKPKLYAPSLIKGTASTIPMVVSWQGSGNRSIKIQYKSGSKWKYVKDAVYSMGTNNKMVGAVSGKSRYWRIVGVTSGKATKVSSAVYVKVV
jgi:hypothetical protein